MGEAAYNIVTTDFQKVTGNFFIDDEVVVGSDMAKFKLKQDLNEWDLVPDFFI